MYSKRCDDCLGIRRVIQYSGLIKYHIMDIDFEPFRMSVFTINLVDIDTTIKNYLFEADEIKPENIFIYDDDSQCFAVVQFYCFGHLERAFQICIHSMMKVSNYSIHATCRETSLYRPDTIKVKYFFMEKSPYHLYLYHTQDHYFNSRDIFKSNVLKFQHFEESRIIAINLERQPIEFCIHNVCKNGGYCFIFNGNDKCACKSDYYGNLCQFYYNHTNLNYQKLPIPYYCIDVCDNILSSNTSGSFNNTRNKCINSDVTESTGIENIPCDDNFEYICELKCEERCEHGFCHLINEKLICVCYSGYGGEYCNSTVLLYYGEKQYNIWTFYTLSLKMCLISALIIIFIFQAVLIFKKHRQKRSRLRLDNFKYDHF
ncbi:hypothetical protein RF11_07593 [Thelohanellus kitauei]|uniref:EGF-like domain-containing protein n=1 Tax=Thelohanellus kitauei TaxID=669202 RepID=A0A0C2MV90_THEKT|nr:hypothetical protein RF11_07593 [Thelohanellus kitauei]